MQNIVRLYENVLIIRQTLIRLTYEQSFINNSHTCFDNTLICGEDIIEEMDKQLSEDIDRTFNKIFQLIESDDNSPAMTINKRLVNND